MKVNLLGSYREIQHIINSPIRGTNSASEFEATLASISPNKPQPAAISQEITAPQGPMGEHESAFRASFNPRALDLTIPEADPLPILSKAPENVNPDPADVKTPTLLSATRVPASDPFKHLTREERVNTVRNLVQAAGTAHGIDPALSMAVVANESSFNAVAVSQDGHFSKGLMQLLDQTGQVQLGRNGLKADYEPFDPKQNVDLGVGYLRHLHDLFSQPTQLPNKSETIAAANSASLEKLAVAAYNAGEGRVAAAQQRAAKAGKNPGAYEDIEAYLPDSTQEYVRRVLASRAVFEPDSAG